MSDKIRVRIQAKQRVHYDQIVEMSREECDDLRRRLDAVDFSIGYDLSAEVEDRLDLKEVFDAEELEDVEIEEIPAKRARPGPGKGRKGR